MPDVSDFELLKTSDHSRLPQRSVGTWVAVALLLVALAAGAYFGYGYYRRAAQPVAETKAGPKIPDRALGGAGESIDLPPLNETDAVVRELVKKVSSHPSIAAWLATDDLIRHFTIIVQLRRHRTRQRPGDRSAQLRSVRHPGRGCRVDGCRRQRASLRNPQTSD